MREDDSGQWDYDLCCVVNCKLECTAIDPVQKLYLGSTTLTLPKLDRPNVVLYTKNWVAGLTSLSDNWTVYYKPAFCGGKEIEPSIIWRPLSNGSPVQPDD